MVVIRDMWDADSVAQQRDWSNELLPGLFPDLFPNVQLIWSCMCMFPEHGDRGERKCVSCLLHCPV